MQVANDTIIMLIGLVYCVIQPIIAPLAMIYFLIGMLIWKYQVVYVYIPLVESGGKVKACSTARPARPAHTPPSPPLYPPRNSSCFDGAAPKLSWTRSSPPHAELATSTCSQPPCGASVQPAAGSPAG